MKWTFLFLVHAEDGKTKRYSNKLIGELLKTRDSDNVRIFILRNTYQYTNEKDMSAILSEVTYNNTINAKELSLKKEYGKINLGDSNVLAGIFTTVKQIVAEETRFMIVTWDHGYSFGIFSGLIDNTVFDFEKNSVNQHNIVTNLKSCLIKVNKERQSDISLDYAIEQFKTNNKNNAEFAGYSNDLLKDLALSDDTDMLTPEEINRALKLSFTKKVDILIMMNCWMQSVDTCYAIADTVDNIIAAESTIDFIGYDYIDFIDHLCIHPEETNKNISERIIKGIKPKYKRMNTEIAFNEIAVSAINPQNIKSLKLTIDNIATSLGLAVRTDLALVSSIRKAVYEYTNEYLKKETTGIYFYYLVDLFEIFKNYAAAKLISKKDFETLKKWFDSFIIAKTIGNNFSSEIPALSLYFPNNKEYILKSTYYYTFYDPKGPLKSRKKFANDSHWANFINDYNKRL